MTAMRGIIHPQAGAGAKVRTIRVRLTTRAIPADATIRLSDVMLQAGATVTGWSPHVTELPWSQGVVGG